MHIFWVTKKGGGERLIYTKMVGNAVFSINSNEYFFSFFFFQNYTPTSFDKKMTDLIVDNQRVSFVIWDTAGTSLVAQCGRL